MWFVLVFLSKLSNNLKKNIKNSKWLTNKLHFHRALSVNVLSPELASRLIPKRDVTNFLLIHTVLGTTLYIYSRPHLQSVEPKKRIAYR